MRFWTTGNLEECAHPVICSDEARQAVCSEGRCKICPLTGQSPQTCYPIEVTEVADKPVDCMRTYATGFVVHNNTVDKSACANRSEQGIRCVKEFKYLDEQIDELKARLAKLEKRKAVRK